MCPADCRIAPLRARVTNPFSPIDRLANRLIAEAVLARLARYAGPEIDRYRHAVDVIAGALDAAAAPTGRWS
jgi:hypothetical protein